MTKTNKQIAKELGIAIEKINAIIDCGLVSVLKKERTRYYNARNYLCDSELYAELSEDEAKNIEDFYKMNASDRRTIVKEFNEVQEAFGKKCMPMAFC